MTQYALFVQQPDGPPPADIDFVTMGQRLAELHDDMRAAGAWVFTSALSPASSATVLRVVDGETILTDGPYVEGKEHIGGMDIVEAPDLDAALGWARRVAEIIGLPIEVRAFSPGP